MEQRFANARAGTRSPELFLEARIAARERDELIEENKAARGALEKAQSEVDDIGEFLP